MWLNAFFSIWSTQYKNAICTCSSSLSHVCIFLGKRCPCAGVKVGSNMHFGSQLFKRAPIGTSCFLYKMRSKHVRTCLSPSLHLVIASSTCAIRLYAPARGVNVAFAAWTWLASSDMEYASWEATGVLGESVKILMLRWCWDVLGIPMQSNPVGWTIPRLEQSWQDKLMELYRYTRNINTIQDAKLNEYPIQHPWRMCVASTAPWCRKTAGHTARQGDHMVSAIKVSEVDELFGLASWL